MKKRFNIRQSLEELVEDVVKEEVPVVITGQDPVLVSSDDDTQDPDLMKPNEVIDPVTATDEVVTIDEIETKEIEPSEEAPMFGTVEFVEEQTDSSNLGEQVAQAIDTVSALEALHEIIAMSKDRGGLTIAGAATAMESVGRYAANMGTKSPFSLMSANESFSTVSMRQRNTEVALEAIEGVMGRILGSVLQAMSSFARRIKRFVDSFIYSLRFQQGQLNAAYKSLATMQDREEPAYFNNQKAIKYLCIDSKFSFDKSLEFCAKLPTSMVSNIIHKMHEVEVYVKTVANNKLDIAGIQALKTPSFAPTDFLPISFKVTKDKSGYFATYENSQALPAGLNMTLVCPLPKHSESETMSHQQVSSGSVRTDLEYDGKPVEFFKRDKVKIGLDKCQTILKNFWAINSLMDDTQQRIIDICDEVTNIKPLLPHLMDEHGKPIVNPAIINAANYANEAVQQRRYRVAIKAVSSVVDNYYTLVSEPVEVLTLNAYETLSSAVKFLYQSTKASVYSKN